MTGWGKKSHGFLTYIKTKGRIWILLGGALLGVVLLLFGSLGAEVEVSEDGVTIHWLIPNAQKKDMEPIMVTLEPGAETAEDLPHMGEEFGHVLAGSVSLVLGEKTYRVRKGDSFSYKPSVTHYLKNTGKTPATLIWVCTPPNF
jgi:quercetin dioxygenase-like cupin family protein